MFNNLKKQKIVYCEKKKKQKSTHAVTGIGESVVVT